MKNNMRGKERFAQLVKEWLIAMGAPADVEPIDFTVARAKTQVLGDVRSGNVPHDVKTFSELHDYVDANYYGDAFEWPDIPSDTEDDLYIETFCNFWNNVQNELHQWIVTGEMRREARDAAGFPLEGGDGAV